MHGTTRTPASPSRENELTVHALARVRDALKDLRYGTVTVTVQDGFVIQVERTEKIRLPVRSLRQRAESTPTR